MDARSREELVDYIDQGNRAKFVFFWGHQKPEDNVSKSCLSQWYDAAFEAGGIYYPTAEHYMMAEKARLFGDQDAEQKILKARHPGEAKSLGRNVMDFDQGLWNERRYAIVIAANSLKFSQNADLQTFLLNTGSRVLVEASPIDPIWGIGMTADDPAVEDPRQWKGLNLLGFALMDVRARLAA